jgi:hypothetical protein
MQKYLRVLPTLPAQLGMVATHEKPEPPN